MFLPRCIQCMYRKIIKDIYYRLKLYFGLCMLSGDFSQLTSIINQTTLPDY